MPASIRRRQVPDQLSGKKAAKRSSATSTPPLMMNPPEARDLTGTEGCCGRLHRLRQIPFRIREADRHWP
jgi:hypothetical protein